MREKERKRERVRGEEIERGRERICVCICTFACACACMFVCFVYTCVSETQAAEARTLAILFLCASIIEHNTALINETTCTCMCWSIYICGVHMCVCARAHTCVCVCVQYRTTHDARTCTLMPNKSVALSASACQVSLH